MNITNLAEETEDFTGNVWLISGNSSGSRGSQKPEEVSSSENVLIDAGTGDSWENIRELESVSKVVMTHSHYDHADNLPKIEDKYEPKIYAFEPANLPVEAEELEEGDTVELAGTSFEIFHTPGHKDDSICLYSSETGIIFTGDLVFPDGGFGRTDLEEGDRDLLIESIQKIAGLDVSAFYSGHGDAFTDNAEASIQDSLEEARKHESKY